LSFAPVPILTAPVEPLSSEAALLVVESSDKVLPP
jgi:hypothetical protein